MNSRKLHHVYGPVLSRRLGRSLGIDPVQFKVCTYDCVYCQLGRTTNKTMDRQEYVPVKGETHEDISFERMVQGLVDFTQSFPGKVWLEVLLLAGGRSFYTHTRSGNGEGKS